MVYVARLAESASYFSPPLLSTKTVVIASIAMLTLSAIGRYYREELDQKWTKAAVGLAAMSSFMLGLERINPTSQNVNILASFAIGYVCALLYVTPNQEPPPVQISEPPPVQISEPPHTPTVQLLPIPTPVGDVGEAPPLPDNIEIILNAPCPFHTDPSMKIRDTHVLVFVPEKVKGNPLNLQLLNELVKAPNNGGHPIHFNAESLNRWNAFPFAKSYRSRWVLMTKKIIKTSKNQLFENNKTFFNSSNTRKAYKVPTVLDAAVCIFMEYIRSEERIYAAKDMYTSLLSLFYTSTPNWIYTYCQEKDDKENHFLLGANSPHGLCLSNQLESKSITIGCAGIRELTEI
jgi:hypothetical protein